MRIWMRLRMRMTEIELLIITSLSRIQISTN
jgi:hypothetical protein